MDISDNALVREILAGEKDLFVTLIDRYDRRIYNLMYRCSGSSDDAAELTRDVFCKAYGKLGSYREETSFFAWLYTLAFNHARDWGRKQRNRRRKLQAWAVEQTVQTTDETAWNEEKEQNERLQAALATLPDDRRELIILRYRNDCSIRELASIFGLSESGVKMRLQRTLETLQQLLSR